MILNKYNFSSYIIYFFHSLLTLVTFNTFCAGIRMYGLFLKRACKIILCLGLTIALKRLAVLRIFVL